MIKKISAFILTIFIITFLVIRDLFKFMFIDTTKQIIKDLKEIWKVSQEALKSINKGKE